MDALKKRVRGLDKKLGQIATLKEAQEAGETLHLALGVARVE